MSIFNALLRPVSKMEIEERKAEAVVAAQETDTEGVVTVGENSESNVITTAHPEESEDVITVANYFKAKEIAIDLSYSNNDFAPVEELAMLLAMNYDKCKDFYKYLRGVIAKKKFDICYNTYPLSTEERAATNMVAEKLGKFGVISNLRIPDNSKEITGKLSTAPRVINFLNGDYLEFYSRIVVKQIVEKIAKEKNCDYELYSNVIIRKDSEKHELDIVFRVGKEVFWAEIKSGKFSDFDCYRRLGVLMGVNPDKHILLSAEKTKEEAETISWFYQFYVSNIHMFKDKLVEMIEHAFEEEGNND